MNRITAHLIIPILAIGLIPLTDALTDVPLAIHYQGQITIDGDAFNDEGQFKFALVDDGTENERTALATANVSNGFVTSVTINDPGNGYIEVPEIVISGGGGSGALAEAILDDGQMSEITVTNAGSGYSSTPEVSITNPPEATMVTLWSHDGSSSGGSEPAGSVSLAVPDGIFSVALGAGSMEELPVEALAQSPVNLRIWFDGGNGFHQLVPDQTLTSVPYALRAQSALQAMSVADGAIGNDQIDSDIGLWTNSGGTLTASNNVGIGTGSPNQALEVNGNIEVNGWMGTARDEPLELRAANEPVMRIQPMYLNADFRPNITIGAPSNQVLGSTTRSGTISGGRGNTVSGNDSTVGGGSGNAASSFFSTIGGGENNEAGGSRATVSGGSGNTGSGSYSSIGGGRDNSASTNYSTVSGGLNNTASGNHAAVGGGDKNIASGSRGTVSGGLENTASGTAATVPGGIDNMADGTASFAAGRRATANHQGAFVWSDSSTAEFASTENDQFLIRAAGGVGIGTNNPAGALHVMGNTAVGGFAHDYRLGVGTNNPWNTLHVVSNDDQGPFRVAVGSNSNTAFRVYPNLGAGIGNSWSESNVPERGLRVHGKTLLGNAAAINTSSPRPEAAFHAKSTTSSWAALVMESTNNGRAWGMRANTHSGSLNFFYGENASDSLTLKAWIETNGSYNRSSDKRLKQNVQPLGPILGRVLELEPVSYRMIRAGDDGETEFGFIAQAVQEVFPEMVQDHEEIEYLGLSYATFSVLAIQAIQEQQEIIEELRNELASLSKRMADNEELDKRLVRIEALLNGEEMAVR